MILPDCSQCSARPPTPIPPYWAVSKSVCVSWESDEDEEGVREEVLFTAAFHSLTHKDLHSQTFHSLDPENTQNSVNKVVFYQQTQ